MGGGGNLPCVANKGRRVTRHKESDIFYSCPEELRRAVVSEIVTHHKRLPRGDVDAERAARQYLDSAMARRWHSTPSGEQLTTQEVNAWDIALASIEEVDRPAWEEDTVLVMAQGFYALNGHIQVPKAKRGDDSEEARLSRELLHVREALCRTSVNSNGRIVRRQLTAQDVAKWDAAVPGVWAVSRGREQFIPPEHVTGHRYAWPREPFLCKL